MKGLTITFNSPVRPSQLRPDHQHREITNGQVLITSQRSRTKGSDQALRAGRSDQTVASTRRSRSSNSRGDPRPSGGKPKCSGPRSADSSLVAPKLERPSLQP